MNAIEKALVLGAAAEAHEPIKVLYASLIDLLRKKYAGINLVKLEKRPECMSAVEPFLKMLEERGAFDDAEVSASVASILLALEKLPPSSKREIEASAGIVIRDTIAKNLRLTNSDATVQIENTVAADTLSIDGVRTGEKADVGRGVTNNLQNVLAHTLIFNNGGVTIDEVKQALREALTDHQKQLASTDSGDDRGKRRVEEEVRAIQLQLSDTEAAVSRWKDRAETVGRLFEIARAQLPETQFESAMAQLEDGDLKGADVLLGSVETKASAYAAEAAYRRGTLAEDAFEFAIADSHYQRAAVFSEEPKYLIMAGLFAHKLGRGDQAATLYEKSIGLLEMDNNNEPITLVRALNNFAGVLAERTQYQQAEQYLNRALTLLRGMTLKDFADTATVLNNLGGIQQEQGRLNEAETLYIQALKLRHQDVGLIHQDIAQIANNLGEVHRARGEIELARARHQEALAIREQVLNQDDPRIAQSLNNLAGIYYQMRQHEDAQGYLLRALKINKKAWGERHRTIALTLNNLGEIAAARGKQEEAASYFGEAVNIAVASTGDASALTRDIRRNYDMASGVDPERVQNNDKDGDRISVLSRLRRAIWWQ